VLDGGSAIMVRWSKACSCRVLSDWGEGMLFSIFPHGGAGERSDVEPRWSSGLVLKVISLVSEVFLPTQFAICWPFLFAGRSRHFTTSITRPLIVYDVQPLVSQSQSGDVPGASEDGDSPYS
jgi:hypothetical protein